MQSGIGFAIARRKKFCPPCLLIAGAAAIFLCGITRIFSAPALTAVYPSGIQRGTTVEVEVVGRDLEGAYGVWFNSEGLKAYVKKVEKIPEKSAEPEMAVANPTTKPKPPDERAIVVIEALKDAAEGPQKLRLVTPRGASNAFKFQVRSERTISENEALTTQTLGQSIEQLPVVINGRFSELGQVDHYVIEAAAGQEILFDLKNENWPEKSTPVLALYEPTGSWFDSGRLRRMKANSQDIAYFPWLWHRFDKAGKYVIETGAMDDNYTALPNTGGPEYVYQLRIVESKEPDAKQIHEKYKRLKTGLVPSLWQERHFARALEDQRLTQLRARAVATPEPTPATQGSADANGAGGAAPKEKPVAAAANSGKSTDVVNRLAENEPNQTTETAQTITFPAIISGSVQQSGDVDCFKFRAQKGEALAFEIETPANVIPQFNPVLRVRDASHKEVLNNIFKEVGGDGDDWVKFLEPKITHVFDAEGEYCLQVQDLTARGGQPDFAYRVLIRPQIPHVGAIKTLEDCVNLGPGGSHKITLKAEYEEGFAGDLVIYSDNLPAGVQILPAVEPRPEAPPELGSMHREKYRASEQTLTLVLQAAEDAPKTVMPHTVRLIARPLLNGKAGPPFPAVELPVMVVRP